MFKDERGVLTGPMATALQEEFGVSTAISPHDMLMNALVWVHKGDVEKAFRDYMDRMASFDNGQRRGTKSGTPANR